MKRDGKSRRRFAASFAATLAVGVVGLLAATPSAAPAPAGPTDVCAVPDALLVAREKAEAKKLYVAILKSAPGTPCAVAGLKTINTPALTCEAADKTFESGNLKGALAAYRRLGDTKCATAGITAVREVVRLCAAGDVDLRLEHDTEARTAYQSALAKNPNAPCAEAGLKELDSLSYKLESLSFTGLMRDITAWMPEILTAIGVAAVLFFLLLLTGYNRRMKRILTAIPVARNILSPRLSLGPIDDSSHEDKLGEALTARIKEHLQRYREEALGEKDGDYDLDYGNGGEDFVNIVSGNGALQNALSNARDISDQTKLVAAVLDLLYGILPIRKISVAGVLEPPVGREACATFSLQDDVQQAAAITLSVPTTTDPVYGDYARLARPAAVWIQYEVTRALKRDDELPASAPSSYALLREGIDRQNEANAAEAKGEHTQAVAKTAEAEHAYEQAVGLNPRNWAARVNLANLRARRTRKTGAAIATVREALDDMRADEARA